jgi:hypothetical protein
MNGIETVPQPPQIIDQEHGFCRKTSPAYVQACCVLRGVTATNVGIGVYLDNFSGTEDEKVLSFSRVPVVDADCDRQ